MDPLAPEYPWNSTYAFAEGDVIRSVDLDGLEKKIVIYWTVQGGGISSLYGGKYSLMDVTVHSIDYGFEGQPQTQIYQGDYETGEIYWDRGAKDILYHDYTYESGIIPASYYDFRNPKDLAEKEADDAYLDSGIDPSIRDRQSPERLWKAYGDASTAVEAIIPGMAIIKSRRGVTKVHPNGTIKHQYYNNDGTLITITDVRGRTPKYTNPGHHDPTSPNFRGGGSKKTQIIPQNHESLWKTAIPDKSGPLTNQGVAKNWYAKDSSGDIHRFQNDHNDKAHWSGSKGGASGLVVPNRIKEALK